MVGDGQHHSVLIPMEDLGAPGYARDCAVARGNFGQRSVRPSGAGWRDIPMPSRPFSLSERARSRQAEGFHTYINGESHAYFCHHRSTARRT